MSDCIFENPQEPWSAEDLPRIARQHMDDTGADPVRLVRLTDPAYYVPGNPHTDDEGRLPHDGGPRPEWCKGKRIEYTFYNGVKAIDHDSAWGWKAPATPIIAYRIVGDGSEDQVRQVPPHRSGGGGSLPEPDVPAFLRDWKPRWGSEGREAPGHTDLMVSPESIPENLGENDPAVDIAEQRHRNELAARLCVPVPGMSTWMHEPLREARRLRYQEATLAGSIGYETDEADLGMYVQSVVNAMLDQEND